MIDNAKVWFLYKRVQHPGFKNAIEALNTMQMMVTDVTYTMAANHISTEVSQLPEYLNKNRSISDLSIRGNSG